MRNEFIQKFIVRGLKSFNPAEHEALAKMVVNSFKQLETITHLSNILIVYNAPFELHINLIIDYCLNNDIDVYIVRYVNNAYHLFHMTQNDNLNLEYYKHTQHPSMGQKQGQYQRFDVVLLPVMAFDQEVNCLDYDQDLNRSLLNRFKTLAKVVCGYGTCLQEYASLKAAKDIFSLDYVINEYRLLIKSK